ncbi:hypothetical protein [Oceaniglobus indicus]|uniref:hypothetical protein n=1 Tax=Oceaniglobus indicus TaxID=2047749 RepID=UPI000C195B4A|nr:hypothetical protein [Oceaniglobus indicus]
MTGTQRLHDATCDVWDLPQAGAAGDLHPATGTDPATDRYLATIAPAYGVLGRVMAQLSGIFLLALTRDGGGPGLHLDHGMYTIARDQLAEAQDTVASVTVPETARRHHAALDNLAAQLAAAARGIERMAARMSGDEHARRDVLRHLAEAQRLLIATAEPDAGITPVDFDNACCSCAVRKPTA